MDAALLPNAATSDNMPLPSGANASPDQLPSQMPLQSTVPVEDSAGIAAGVAALTLEPAFDMACYEDLFSLPFESSVVATNAASHILADWPGVSMSGVSHASGSKVTKDTGQHIKMSGTSC